MNEIRNLQEKIQQNIVQDQASKCSSDNSSEAKTEQDTTTAPTTTTTTTTITSIGSANNTNNNNLLTRKTSAPTPSPSPSPKIGSHQPSATANASNSFKMTSFSSIPTNLSKTSTNASLTLNQNSIKNGLNALSTTSNNNNTNTNNGTNHMVAIDETPNKIVYKKMEIIIEKMQEDQAGVPIRTVKSFMSKIPSVFTGSDLIQWMLKKLDVEDACESLHLAHLFASNGYIFPIDDHILTVKNDGTFFRFQTPFYWPSNNSEPDNTDYAVYLCKRTMQNKTRLELADYEAENLAKLQKLLTRKWEFIYMQAEAQIKVDKKRDKMERKILDSQERAFWDVYRPAPGCVNTTEVDMRKTLRMRRTDFPNIGFFGSKKFHNQATHSPASTPITQIANHTLNTLSVNNTSQTGGTSQANSNWLSPASAALGAVTASVCSSTLTTQQKLSEADELVTLENLCKEKDFLKRRLERRYVKSSKVQESYTNYYDQYNEFDPFFTAPDPSNPWISDSTEFWDMEKSIKDIPQRRVKRWGFSIHELLKDPSGRDLFRRFLEREFSSENLRFYEVCNELRYASNKDIASRVNDIYNEFLAPGANCPINIDSRIMAITKSKIESPDRYTYDEAREHIFNLMTRDSYNRFLRSEAYRDSLATAKKKPKSISMGRLSIVRPILNSN